MRGAGGVWSAAGVIGQEGVGEVTAMPEGDASIVSRRRFLRDGVRGASLVGLGAAAGVLGFDAGADGTVWQIDPDKCIACGNCATYCVLVPSAVKCVHAFAMCGYCDLCTGFFEPDPNALNTGAENQLCPAAAIERTFVEDPYYEYVIDESKCIGCGRCVKGCAAFGNASLFLQIRHDRCANCNECAIAAACPAEAIRRVPAHAPYLLKGEERGE
jgi:electron transport complex protein RnfB